MSERSSGPVGVICPPDHDVFGPVATRLRDRGFAVRFLEPGRRLSPGELSDLGVLVNKKMRPESVEALYHAERLGVSTWNGLATTLVHANRLSDLAALELAGWPVPESRLRKPDGDYVAKNLYDVRDDPVVGGEGDFYQPLLDADGVDYKHYAVHDGDDVQVAVVRFRSKLHGERTRLGSGDLDPANARRIEDLLDVTGARALGVDLVTVDGEYHAIDVNTATSFRHTGLEDALADSIADAARSGPGRRP